MPEYKPKKFVKFSYHYQEGVDSSKFKKIIVYLFCERCGWLEIFVSFVLCTFLLDFFYCTFCYTWKWVWKILQILSWELKLCLFVNYLCNKVVDILIFNNNCRNRLVILSEYQPQYKMHKYFTFRKLHWQKYLTTYFLLKLKTCHFM